MGKESQTTAMRYQGLPDKNASKNFVKSIAKKPVCFEPRKVDKSLILYGAGDLGKMAREYFERLDIPFLFVVDMNPDLHRKDSFWEGIDIYSLQEVPIDLRKDTLLAICVATAPFSQVIKPLMEQGWKDVVPFYDIAEAYRDRHPLSNGWYSGKLSQEDICVIESVLTRWDDDLSRAHHLQFLAWRCLREEWLFDDAPVITNNRYFIPEVLSALHDKEVFVDIGAHYGDVIIRFLDAVKNKYKGLYAIEPDSDSFDKLCLRIKDCMSIDKEKLILLQYALGNIENEKRFYQGIGYASQFSKFGQTKLDVKRLDDLCIPATFIKLHVEGWEWDVIDGGMETILSHRPILAVTSYHNRDGLWKLPKGIMNCVDAYNYTYFFRLHSWYGTGSVIYAIPTERLPK